MVFFSNILDDAGKGRDDNKDALDSLMACLYGFGTGDLFGKRKKKEINPEENKMLRQEFYMEGGTVKSRWV
jgi:hypothetical protein